MTFFIIKWLWFVSVGYSIKQKSFSPLTSQIKKYWLLEPKVKATAIINWWSQPLENERSKRHGVVWMWNENVKPPLCNSFLLWGQCISLAPLAGPKAKNNVSLWSTCAEKEKLSVIFKSFIFLNWYLWLRAVEES